MAWTAPRTWVAGETPTAAIMNAHIRDNLLETAPGVVTSVGDVLVADGANSIKRLALGTANYFLKVNGGGTDITWSAS